MAKAVNEEVERLVFFSDAVFAIALTLLAVDLRLPDDVESVSDALRDMGPALTSFVISFVVIALLWLAHNRVFAHIVRNDPKLMVANLFLLMLVTLVPFPTSVLGDYPDDPAAVAFYASAISVVTAASAGVWLVARARGLLDHQPDRRETLLSVAHGLSLSVVFLASVPIAFAVSPEAAQYFWFLAFVLRFATRPLARPTDADT